jgi:hypothetical protein
MRLSSLFWSVVLVLTASGAALLTPSRADAQWRNRYAAGYYLAPSGYSYYYPGAGNDFAPGGITPYAYTPFAYTPGYYSNGPGSILYTPNYSYYIGPNLSYTPGSNGFYYNPGRIVWR